MAPRTIAIEKVVPNPRNLREDDLWTHDDERDETIASVLATGVLQALLVGTRDAFIAMYPQHKEDESLKAAEYVIIAGHRRHEAARLAGLTDVRIDVRDELLPDLDLVMLEENLKRKGLNVFQEGEGYRRLAAAGASHAEIAKRVGKGKSTVTKRIALLDLPKDARQAILDKQVSIDNAYNLLTALDGEGLDRFLEAAEIMKQNKVSATDAVNTLFYSGSDRTETEEPSSTAETTTTPAAATPTGQAPPTTPAPDSGPDAAGAPESENPETVGDDQSETAPADDAPESESSETVGRARSHASRNRFCQNLIAEATDLLADPRTIQVGTMALGHATPGAVERAHGWMKAAGATDASAFEQSESYRDAILARGDANLIARFAYAVALGQAEVRASSGRRTWDYRDAAHLQHLIDSGYEPTEWERRHLG
ncbi:MULTISPECIES: ParB/RepB/Spo0J family partition protein [Streptomyces]|uniref:ParB/RepB/Spo0J family partition protein n=1 Tax=Streptomyces TaxID=1883 RepID=UPI0004BD92A3|nr:MULTISPECIES: ParB/RepB/Spo0J family partition protein [Streptomyces]